jgi:transposase
MKDVVNITPERVDDVPLVLTHLQRMGLAAALESHVPTHSNGQGLSLGQRSTIWLAHVHSEGDHRRNHVQHGLAERETVQELNDDRLAEMLHALSGQVVRVSQRDVQRVRLESNTASSDASVSEEGLVPCGHRKGRRSDVPQRNVMLAALDPLGMPLATDMHAGEHADDPLDVPMIARVHTCLGRHGLLSVGDCKMGALQTRACMQPSQDSSLCPLSALVMPAEHIAQAVGEPLQVVEHEADGSVERIARGDEQALQRSAEVNGHRLTWTERRVLVRSLTLAKASEQAMRVLMARAQSTLAHLVLPRRGKPRLNERADVEQVLVRERVEGLLDVRVQDTVTEQRVRASGSRPASTRLVRQFTLSCQINALAQLGWRVSAATHDTAHLTLKHAVGASRDDYLVECNVGRVNGHPLSLAPLDVARDDQAIGLVHCSPAGFHAQSLHHPVWRFFRTAFHVREP